MEKKKYVKPSLKVYPIENRRILCGSPIDTGYVPTIPGQPTDDKHLA